MKKFFAFLSLFFLGGILFHILPGAFFSDDSVVRKLFGGIFFSDVSAGFGVNNEDFFSNYSSWSNSTTLDANDTVIQTLFNLYGSGNSSSLADINGDGLTDVMVHLVSSTRKYAILINNGNIGFDLVYKCVKTSTTWYGDCAQ